MASKAFFGDIVFTWGHCVHLCTKYGLRSKAVALITSEFWGVQPTKRGDHLRHAPGPAAGAVQPLEPAPLGGRLRRRGESAVILLHPPSRFSRRVNRDGEGAPAK